MKKSIISYLLCLCVLLSTSSAFAAINNKYFTADKQYFDIETGRYVVSGNIIISLGNGKILGEKAQVSLPTLEFWGSGGWEINQEDVYFRGESVYVLFKENEAYIDNGANFQRPDLQIDSDKVTYNWKTKIATFEGNVKVTQAGNATMNYNFLQYNVEKKAFVS